MSTCMQRLRRLSGLQNSSACKHVDETTASKGTKQWQNKRSTYWGERLACNKVDEACWCNGKGAAQTGSRVDDVADLSNRKAAYRSTMMDAMCQVTTLA